MFHFTKKLSSNTPPQSTLLNHKIIILLSLLLLIAVISISLFICSSCAISSTNYQDNPDSTIINYEIKSKETNIPPAAETYATNYVNWCLYSDGALVINGTNAPTYNGHNGIIRSGTNLDLNQAYLSSWSTQNQLLPGGKIPIAPWLSYKTTMVYDNPLDSGTVTSTTDIISVEFAKSTKPTNMENWFYDCVSLKSINSKNLDVSSVKNMSYMFYGCTSLSDLSGLSTWAPTSAKYMNSMFYGCTSLSDLSGLFTWAPTSATNMSFMFCGCTSLENLSGIFNNVSSVTTMSSMFDGCTSLSNLSGLSNWNFSSATDLSFMFRGCTSLENLSGIFNNVSSVTNMSYMFYGCTSLSDLSGLFTWAPTSATKMNSMFYGCTSL